MYFLLYLLSWAAPASRCTFPAKSPNLKREIPQPSATLAAPGRTQLPERKEGSDFCSAPVFFGIADAPFHCKGRWWIYPGAEAPCKSAPRVCNIF